VSRQKNSGKEFDSESLVPGAPWNAINREDPECPPEPEHYLTAKGKKTRAAAAGFSHWNDRTGNPPAILGKQERLSH